MLVLSRRIDEDIYIDDDIRIVVDVPQDINITRGNTWSDHPT